MEDSTCIFTVSHGPIANRLGLQQTPQYTVILLCEVLDMAKSTIVHEVCLIVCLLRGDDDYKKSR